MRDAQVPELDSGHDVHGKEPAEMVQDYALALKDPQVKSAILQRGGSSRRMAR